MAGLAMKNKKGTVIHRTTSETLRLGDTDLLTNHTPVRVSVQSSNSRKKSQTSPSCSFQITGVSLTRCDLGDDSADDLDESHTDDISRVTDNETPSFSEDSRDTDDHLLQPIHNPITTTVPSQQQQQQTDIKWQDQDNRDLGLGRFKVVKIESVAPFSRGRWTCFDYLDHSENAPKVSYVYCKQQFVRQGQDKCTNGGNLRATGASLVDSSYVEENGVHKRIQNPSNVNFWEPHCQEYLYHAGTMILPHQIFVPISRQQKNKTRASCPVSPAPVKITTDSISSNNDNTTISNESTEIVKTNDNLTQQDAINNPINTTLITNDVQTQPVDEENSKEIVTQNGTSNSGGASVSCTATIDTKIEHALDVVKNHLTHAVRLEVEELKVKINELVDRISYLEYENDLLRANVAPDVLATLGNHRGEK